MEMLHTPSVTLQLDRLPLQSKELLRAWDAADLILLNYIYEHIQLTDINNVLIINDQFGALACALSAESTVAVSSYSDSYISELSTRHNMALNKLNKTITFIPSTETINEQFDLIIIKLPKINALLETQLNGLGQQLTAKGRIIAAGMCKHMSKSTLSLFEKHIGTTTTSLAEKKARLIFCDNKSIAKSTLPYPIDYIEESLALRLRNHANVFSKDKLDIGARFFLEHFKKLPNANKIIDLGCGNGVLGIMAHRQNPAATVHFIDESHMAIRSAKENFAHEFSSNEKGFFHLSECLTQVSDIHPELILCNPPFHQQHSTGDQIAWRMFRQSHQQLKPQGELWVIANRHLNYHLKLQRLFGHCETIASNKKFVILKAIKE